MRWTPVWSLLSVLLLAPSACGEGDPIEAEPPESTVDAAAMEVVVASACEPLAGVNVRLFDEGESTPAATATTDQAGEAVFMGLPSGTYAVELELPDGHGLNPEEVDRKSRHLSQSAVARLAFALVPDPQPSVTDHEGSRYAAVKIGEQVWMAENLRVTTFANGEPIPERASDDAWLQATEEDLPGWAYYQNDPEYGEAYGPMYNNHAAMDPRGVCPAGWHIPTEEDWRQLEVELGVGESFLGRIGYAGGPVGAGSVLKSTRTAPTPHPRWEAPNEDALNCTGFSGVAGGYRVGHPTTADQVTSQFRQIDGETAWWGTMPAPVGNGRFGRGLVLGNRGIYRNYADGYGFAIRCVKDAPG